MKKRILSIFLAALMIVSLLPVTAFAATTTNVFVRVDNETIDKLANATVNREQKIIRGKHLLQRADLCGKLVMGVNIAGGVFLCQTAYIFSHSCASFLLLLA